MALDGTANAPGKIGMHADAWGVRKLMSHCLRSLRLGRVPRVLGLIGNLHSISYWGFNGIGMVIYGRLPDPPLACHKDEGVEELFEIFRVAWCLEVPSAGDPVMDMDDEDCSNSKGIYTIILSNGSNY